MQPFALEQLYDARLAVDLGEAPPRGPAPNALDHAAITGRKRKPKTQLDLI